MPAVAELELELFASLQKPPPLEQRIAQLEAQLLESVEQQQASEKKLSALKQVSAKEIGALEVRALGTPRTSHFARPFRRPTAAKRSK